MCILHIEYMYYRYTVQKPDFSFTLKLRLTKNQIFLLPQITNKTLLMSSEPPGGFVSWWSYNLSLPESTSRVFSLSILGSQLLPQSPIAVLALESEMFRGPFRAPLLKPPWQNYEVMILKENGKSPLGFQPEESEQNGSRICKKIF